MVAYSSLAENLSSNSRRHHRVNVGPEVLPDPSFTPINISESGIKVFSLAMQIPGNEITLRLNLLGERLEVVGKIIWSKESTSIFEKGFYSGLVFVDHSISKQLIIRKFVKSYS